MHSYDENQCMEDTAYRMMDINESQNCLALLLLEAKGAQKSGFF